jgi:hypothetical protein
MFGMADIRADTRRTFAFSRLLLQCVIRLPTLTPGLGVVSH